MMATRLKTRTRRYQKERDVENEEIRALRAEYGYDGHDSHLNPSWSEPVGEWYDE